MMIDENHPSIQAIKTNKPNTNTDTLTFKPVTPTVVDKQINKLNIKKATGFDDISAKMIKLRKPVATGPITSLMM
jgi:transcription termination factor Rho